MALFFFSNMKCQKTVKRRYFFRKMLTNNVFFLQEGETIVKEELELILSILTKKVEELSTLYDDTVKDLSNQIKTIIEGKVFSQVLLLNKDNIMRRDFIEYYF